MIVLDLIFEGSVFPWLLVIFPFVYVSVQCYLNYRKCSSFRGPFLATFSNIWLFKSTLRGRVYLDCASQLDKYGRRRLELVLITH